MNPLLTIFKPVGLVKYQQEAEAKGAGLMTIPREIRDQIYHHLLCVDRFCTLKNDKTGFSKLEMSILRVSHTLYREASEALYEDNPWVCVTIEPSLLQSFRRARILGSVMGFPGDEPVQMASYSRAAAVAVATINLQRLPQFGFGVDRVPLVVSLFAVPRLCRILTNYTSIHELELRVRLNALDTGKWNRAWHNSLLEYLKEARGFGRVTVSDAGGNTSHVELATVMMSPFASSWAVFDRASTYYDRAFQKQKQGVLSEARCEYQNGLDFIRWFAYLSLERRFDKPFDRSGSLIELWNKISFSCAFLCIKLGDLDWALRNIDGTLDEQWMGGTTTVQPEAWFLYGLRDLAIGAGDGAAYCFLQTLWKQPGHLGADEAIDGMEARLRGCTGLAESITLENIHFVLQPFRHQIRGGPVMSKYAYENFLQQWISGREETDSVGYRHCKDGSISLLYSSMRNYWF